VQTPTIGITRSPRSQQQSQHARQVQRAAGELVAHEILARVGGVPGRLQDVNEGQHRVDALSGNSPADGTAYARR
jgi:hypothetical protein